MSIGFDAGEVSAELAKLRSVPHLHKVAVVLPLAEGKRDVARDFLAEGPPFDIGKLGLDSHEVFLTDNEVIFVFGTPGGMDSLEKALGDEDFWSVVSSWEHIADGRPRIAEIAYDWHLGSG